MADAFYVGDWLVEADQNRIGRGGVRIRLDPKSIELLTYLSEHPDEVLSKEEILTSVWDGAFVSDEVLTTAISGLRKALGDDAHEPRYIKTIPRRGYRLIAAVETATGDGRRETDDSPLPEPSLPVGRSRSRSVRFSMVVVSLAIAFAAGREVGVVTTARDAPAPAVPHRLTFRGGLVWNARFAPDGESVLYSATWQGDENRLYTTGSGSPESRPLGLDDADILAVSSSGELAVALNPSHRGGSRLGTLAVMPGDGAAPRPLLENVRAADWPREGGDLAVLHVVDGQDRVEYPIGNVIYEAPDPLIGDIRLSPRGDLVAFWQLDSIRVVDKAGTSRVVTRGWRGTMELAWSADGKEIWFSGADAGFIPSTYATTLEGKTRLLLWGMGIEDVAPSGDALFRRREGRMGITFVDAAKGVERDLSWLDWGHVVDISDDGSVILFAESGQGGGIPLGAYLRPTDGEPAVRLSDGLARALSPDGRHALVVRFEGPRVEFVSVPTGAGEERRLFESEYVPEARAEGQYGGRFLPDGDHVAIFSFEPGEGPRPCLLSLDDLTCRLITREPVGGQLVTPDGKWLLARGSDGPSKLYSLWEDESRAVAGLEREDTPVQWSRDGRYLFVRRDWGDDPDVVSVQRIELATGARTLVREYVPNPNRVANGLPLVMTKDPRVFAYTYARFHQELYLVEDMGSASSHPE